MFKTIAWVCGLIVLITVAGFLTGMVTLPFRTASTIAERTFDGDNVIANYEWFHRQYEDINAMDTKLADAKASYAGFLKDSGPQDKWTFEDKNERNRLNGVILGLQNQKHMMVAEYNAKSAMVNRSIFKGGSLPETMPDI